MSGGSKADIRTEKERKRAEALRNNLRLRKAQQRERDTDMGNADKQEEQHDCEDKRTN